MGEEEERRMNGLNYCSGSGSASSSGSALASSSGSASASSSSSSSGCCLMDCSNIGYKLLKKQGWVEGTGLGASLQGRLEPVETHLKKNKKGIGAEKPKTLKTTTTLHHIHNKEPMSKREKAVSKRMRKMVEEEKRRQEKEFDQAFFREFWPDNV